MVEEVGGWQLQLVPQWTFAQADRRLADSGEGERWGLLFCHPSLDCVWRSIRPIRHFVLSMEPC